MVLRKSLSKFRNYKRKRNWTCFYLFIGIICSVFFIVAAVGFKIGNKIKLFPTKCDRRYYFVCFPEKCEPRAVCTLILLPVLALLCVRVSNENNRLKFTFVKQHRATKVLFLGETASFATCYHRCRLNAKVSTIDVRNNRTSVLYWLPEHIFFSPL